MSQYGLSYKAEDVPKEVVHDFKGAAGALGHTLKRAFAHLIRPPGRGGIEDRAAWEARIRKLILAGQRRAGEFRTGGRTEMVSVHVPREHREALSASAKALGVNVGAAGRLILIGLAGRFDTALLPDSTVPTPKGGDGAENTTTAG